MASPQIDTILQVYKQLAQNRNLSSARISFPKNAISIRSVWDQSNLERRKKQKFSQEFSFDSSLQLLLEGYSSDISSEVLTSFSKNDELKAVLRDVVVEGKSKQFIEIWDRYHLIKSYDLSAFDVHGEVYSGVTFSAFQWSSDSTKLLYVAEKKLPKTEPFYKQKSASQNSKLDNEEPSKGTEFVYKPDWGEQLVGKHRSVAVILNIKEDTIVPVDSIPDDYFPAQVLWAPNGIDIVGVAYKIKSRYLGLYACTNRESYIFHLKQGEFIKLTKEGLACRAPRFDPNGKYLVWLERNLTVPHHHVHRIMLLEWDQPGPQPSVLVDTVKKQAVINKDKKFYGVYNQSFPKRCWSEDSKYLFFSTPQRSNIKSYFVNLETKTLTEIDNDDSSLIVLDVKKNYLTFSKSSLILPPQLIIGKFETPSANVENIYLHHCTTPFIIPKFETLMHDITEYVYDNNDTTRDINFIYFGKKGGPEKSLPLIAMAHGGPHSTFSNQFSLPVALFALLGFGVVQINYRGSIGMGGDNVEYILGKVGESDVLDCVTAINTCLKKYSWLDPKNLCLFGGSHGGFLNAHLSGQHPDMFKAVVMRNPVIDLAAMFSISDIPDWCPGEAGSSLGVLPETTPKSNYAELMQILLKHSPILHADKVKAATLIKLGSNDLRVPMSQGKQWYFNLKANNIKTKLLIYEDNHSLLKEEVLIDGLVNSALWFLENISDN